MHVGRRVFERRSERVERRSELLRVDLARALTEADEGLRDIERSGRTRERDVAAQLADPRRSQRDVLLPEQSLDLDVGAGRIADLRAGIDLEGDAHDGAVQ